MNNRLIDPAQGTYNYMNMQNLIRDVRQGDSLAINYLRQYVVKKSALANKRLRQLETHSLTEYAYQRTYVFLKNEYNSVKFPQAVKGRTVDSLIIQALELQHFISDKTSTLRGAREAALKNYQGLVELSQLGYNISFDPDRLKTINNIMGSDGLKALSGRYRYEIIDMINNALDQDYTFQDVQRNIDRYQSGEISFDELLSMGDPNDD